MPKVFAPNRAYSGISAGVQFSHGEGSTDDERALAWFRTHGYGIDQMPSRTVEEATAKWHESVGPVLIGGPLRDAAVEPRETDFLGPTNAGLADPHGPLVVSPGLHAGETGPIRPGPVAVDDPVRQDAEETELAERVFVNQELVPDVIADIANTQARATAVIPTEAETPTPRSTKAAWVDFAVRHGASRDDAEDMTKAQLSEQYGAS